MRAVALVLGSILIGHSASEILTNVEKTEYGYEGLVINPKSSKLVLKCNFTGESMKDRTHKYAWYKNGSPLEASSKFQIQNEGTASSLIVDGSDVADAGNYTCKFSNEEEAAINVYMYPTLEHVERSKNQVQGDPLTLLCKARGYPTPRVFWYKDDVPVEIEDRIQMFEIDNVEGAKLVITDLQFSDKGKYVCKATALNVTRQVDITVRVKDKYAALWPFLGICAEVAILCTIIFIYEKRRTKPEFDDDDDKKESSRRK